MFRSIEMSFFLSIEIFMGTPSMGNGRPFVIEHNLTSDDFYISSALNALSDFPKSIIPTPKTVVLKSATCSALLLRLLNFLTGSSLRERM